MKKFAALVFDETIYTNAAVYTAQRFNEVLASADRLVLHAVADETGGTSPTLLVQIEHSGDGRNFGNKNAAAEIPATSIPPSATTSLIGSDSSTIPTLPFARLRVVLGGSGSLVGHIKVYACGRDW